MPLIDSYVALSKDVESRLESAKASLGLVDIYFGDQLRIPRTPTVCVEPGGKRRELNGLPRRTDVSLTVYLIVYHYHLKKSEENRELNDTLAEDLETFLHQDAQFRDIDGIPTVIDSLVTTVESDYLNRNNSLFRASRLTLEARSQVQLPMNTP